MNMRSWLVWHLCAKWVLRASLFAQWNVVWTHKRAEGGPLANHPRRALAPWACAPAQALRRKRLASVT